MAAIHLHELDEVIDLAVGAGDDGPQLLVRGGLQLLPVHEVGRVGLADILVRQLQHPGDAHEVLDRIPDHRPRLVIDLLKGGTQLHERLPVAIGAHGDRHQLPPALPVLRQVFVESPDGLRHRQEVP